MRLVAVRCPRRVGAGMMISFCARVVIYGDNKIRSALMRPAPKAHKPPPYPRRAGKGLNAGKRGDAGRRG